MPYIRLALQPGIDKQNTEYGAEGGWTDGDYVRFRYGLPEKIGGWKDFEQTPVNLIGLATDAFTWNALDGIASLMIGTNRKLYVFKSGTWADITPIRATSAAGDATFSAVNGSRILTVTQIAHEAITGDFVTFSDAVSLGGVITAPVLNQEYEITLVKSATTYEITSPIIANASDTGNGGVATIATYQINIGAPIGYVDFGWGVGTWGTNTWGTPRDASASINIKPRIWQLDAYGEDVICQVLDGGIYLYDTSLGLQTRVTAIAGAPTKSKFALVSTPDRHLICFGTESTLGVPATIDPMFVRFSDQENINEFVESATNTAGGQRLTDGSTIISAVRSRGQILIFTDTSLHAMQYVGPPFVFGFQQLGANCGCIGSHAAVDVNGIAFWMGPEAFYMFDGTVKKMACTVQDYVFKDLNQVQGIKLHAGVNSQFNEVTWWYSSFTSDYNDRYVTYNYLENVWSTGSMPRTSWTDIGTYRKPIATQYLENSNEATLSTIQGLTAGRSIVYNQEDGFDANGEPIYAYVVSGYFDLGEGDSMLFMKRFIPDFKNQIGNLTVRLLLRPYPQATASPSSLDPYVITPTTQKVDTRARGRQIQLTIESTDINTNWRFGTLRIDAQPDGAR
jgi:hypothetical protein